METKMKKCSRCGLEKDVGEFTTRVVSPDGLDYKCKGCLKDIRAERKKAKAGGGKDRRKSNRSTQILDGRYAPKRAESGELLTKASPAEILIALRRGVAAEIVATITEKYEL